MPLRTIRGNAERRIAASVETCRRTAADAPRWPEWLSAVRSVTEAEGRLVVEARLLAIALFFLAEVETDAEGVTIRRAPFAAGDDERLEIVITLTTDSADVCLATAEIDAELDVPRLLPVPAAIADQVAGRLLSDLEKHVS